MRRLVSAVAVLAFLGLGAGPASADHAWLSFHWGRMTPSFALELGDNTTTADWRSVLGIAAADWSKSTVLDTVVARGRAVNSQACLPSFGRVEICNGRYGEVSWIGIAQVWTYADGHIAQGLVRNNDSYLDSPKYPELSTLAWKQFVMCQEIGHTFGLDHQDEGFGNANLGTCMDYTRDPDGTLLGQASNEHPDKHDFRQLQTIYKHLDAVNTVGSTGVAVDGSFTPGAQQRGTNRFVHALPGGGWLASWVIWL